MIKEEVRKVAVNKSAYDLYYDLTLFAFRCEAFTFAIIWKDFLCQFRSCDKTILLPEPNIIRSAILDFAEHGDVEKMFALPCVYFRSSCFSYLEGFLSVQPSFHYYATQLIKAYTKFYNSFINKNFIIY